MKNLLDGIEEVLLMGPGPSCVPPQVYEAIGKKTLGHLDPCFLKIMDELKERLRTLLNTKNNLTVPISGTGSKTPLPGWRVRTKRCSPGSTPIRTPCSTPPSTNSTTNWFW
mgnify:CR=1 FL=1